jgi:hypothetical protein
VHLGSIGEVDLDAPRRQWHHSMRHVALTRAGEFDERPRAQHGAARAFLLAREITTIQKNLSSRDCRSCSA